MGFRNYRREDYPALCDFLVALNEPDRGHINWNWARLEWMIEHPECDRSLLGSVGLWREGERIVGAAIYDMYFGEAFCGALPGYEALYLEILDYAWRELRDEAGLGVSICEDSAFEIAAAEAAGFVRAEQTETVMRVELDGTPTATLPEGLRLAEIDFASESDLRTLQWLLWRGFDHGDDRAAFEEDLERTRRLGLKLRPHFDKRLSLAALDGAGEGAAYCCLWVRPDTDYAYVEPVCTVPAWRGKGAAKALLYEAFARARSLGAKSAYVISDQAFYEKLGFRTDRRFVYYWKK